MKLLSEGFLVALLTSKPFSSFTEITSTFRSSKFSAISNFRLVLKVPFPRDEWPVASEQVHS